QGRVDADAPGPEGRARSAQRRDRTPTSRGDRRDRGISRVEIPNPKSQIPNSKMSWDLGFGIWNLGFSFLLRGCRPTATLDRDFLDGPRRAVALVNHGVGF